MGIRDVVVADRHLTAEARCSLSTLAPNPAGVFRTVRDAMPGRDIEL